jgi:hypothetical protein
MSNISRVREPRTPTLADLRWFAGFFAGDGSVRSFKGKGLGLKVTQIDPEIPYLAQDWFGGSVSVLRSRTSHGVGGKEYRSQPQYEWFVGQKDDAFGLAMTLWAISRKVGPDTSYRLKSAIIRYSKEVAGGGVVAARVDQELHPGKPR